MSKLSAKASFKVTPVSAVGTSAITAVPIVKQAEVVEPMSKKKRLTFSLDSDENSDFGNDVSEDSDEFVRKDDLLDSTADEESTGDDDSLEDEDDAAAEDDAAQDDLIINDDEEQRDLLIVNKEDGDVMNMKGLREKVQKVLIKLEQKNFKENSRAQLIDELKSICCQYYDYSEYMLDRLFHLFKPSEFIDFLEANETPRPVTIRVNTLKVKRRELAAALIARGVNVEPLDKWTPVGLQIFEGASKVPIGATPEYLAGQYMLQAAASFLPVMALAPGEGERVLDMCAAPGGKTTHIAAMMRNTGFLAANDISEERCRSLNANMHRMGVQNAVVSAVDGRKLQVYYGLQSFDRILLDAPCSGTGIISKDASVKGKTEQDFSGLGQVQRELILAAIDMATINGVIVYSTCSVTVEENEAVVEYALRKRAVKLVDCGLPFGSPGFTAFRGAQFDRSMNLTRRYFPHTHNLDGFFVAKLIKVSNKKE